jgi:hypothetical protein
MYVYACTWPMVPHKDVLIFFWALGLDMAYWLRVQFLSAPKSRPLTFDWKMGLASKSALSGDAVILLMGILVQKLQACPRPFPFIDHRALVASSLYFLLALALPPILP